MKYLISISIFLIGSVAGFAQLSPQITSWVVNSNSAVGSCTACASQTITSIPANIQTVQYSATQVYVSATCVPDYNIGPWTANPNQPSNQNLVCKFTRAAIQNTSAAVSPGLGNIGLWSNGVAIYNPKDGYYWNNSTSSFSQGSSTTGFNRNALVYEGISFDNCLGHPGPNGAYHNHVNPKCLYNSSNTTSHAPIIGYAFDGFPIYGAFGYSTPTNSLSAIKRMTPSFVLAPSTGTVLLGANSASAAVTPTTPTTRTSGPPVNTIYPLGNMLEDYVYVAGSGDLDYHNGRYCVTPEYPNGTYAYFVTIDANGYPVYPFVIGPTYYGSVQAGNTGPSGGHNTITEATTIYTPTTTGIIEGLNRNIKCTIWPNPVEDFTSIYMDVDSKNNVKGSLYNTKGQLMQTFDNLQPSISYPLDMSNYSSGIYMLILEAGNKVVKQKIMKVK